jgi:MFS family permease
MMLLLATVVNYMDRQTLGSLATYIKADFHLNEEGYGKLEAVFGYSYAAFVIVAGFMADRWNLRWLYAIALLVWSVAGFATGFAQTLLQLQICRAILGAGEAFNWPVDAVNGLGAGRTARRRLAAVIYAHGGRWGDLGGAVALGHTGRTRRGDCPSCAASVERSRSHPVS